MTAALRPISGRKFLSFSQGRIAARKYAREQARLRNSLSRGFQKKLLTVFNRSIKKATDSLDNQQIPEIGVISQSFQSELAATLKAQVRRVYSAVYDMNYQRYKDISTKDEGDPFDFRRSVDFERAVGMYFVGRENMMVGITDTTGRQILNRIEKLRGEDNTLDQIARQLPKEFAQINRRRANVIARTETHSAAGYAHHDYHAKVSDSYGVQMVKQWVATSDARTRTTHAMMNGAKVMMDEKFLMPDGARMEFCGDSRGGAKHVINCRCVTLYHEPEDLVEDLDAMPTQSSSDQLELGKDGLPLGITEKQLVEEIRQGKRDFKTSRTAFRTRLGALAQDERWGDGLTQSRFSGRRVSDYGKNKLGSSYAKTELGRKTFMMIEEVSKELDMLAEKFKVPPLRGYKQSKKSVAAMGDGVMTVNADSFRQYDVPAVASTWKRGDPLSDRPYGAPEYFDDQLGQIRSVMYHEFGHHVHQMKYYEQGAQAYTTGLATNRKLELRLQTMWKFNSDGMRNGSASRYGTTNNREWFAENFSLWATRKTDLVDPEFIDLIDDVLKD